ncbi:hypothetical protein ITJ10_13725, partial [Clostridioides difficile]|nr:hypothetical protein [Clostridioides difficile]
NITVIHITHFMEEAVEADRVVVMEKGKKILEGTPREVFSKIKITGSDKEKGFLTSSIKYII